MTYPKGHVTLPVPGVVAGVVEGSAASTVNPQKIKIKQNKNPNIFLFWLKIIGDGFDFFFVLFIVLIKKMLILS